MPRSGTVGRGALAAVVALASLFPATAYGMPPASPAVSGLHILRVSPADGTAETPRTTPVVVFFDRPVVPLAAVEAPPPAAPARVEPATPGHGRWLNTATWAWYPAPALHGATRYTLTVPAGLRAVDGTRLAAAYTAAFTTPRPAVARVSPPDGAAYADFRAPLTVRFNQGVDHALAAASFALHDGAGATVPGTFQWPRADTLVFRPRGRLALGAHYTTTLGAGWRSAEGPLPPAGGTSWSFTTAELPTVADSSPTGGDRVADLSNGLTLHFNAPVDPRLVGRRLQVIPRPANMNVNTSDDGLTVSVYGGWLPSAHYHVVLDGVIGAYGQALPAPFRLGFITAPLAPAVQFPYNGAIVSFDAYRPIDVALRAVNVHTVYLTLYRLSRQEFSGLLQGTDLTRFQPASPALATLTRHPSGALNKVAGVGQELSAPGRQGLAPGFYFLRAGGAEGGQDQIAFMVTRTALTFKGSTGRTLVWATDLHSGRPLPGLLVRVVRTDSGALVAAGHTGPDGMLDTRYVGPQQPYNLIALLDRPGDAALCSSNWSGGVNPSDYSLPNAVGSSPGRHMGYLYTDRPIYRPGQPVRFRGLVRRDDDGAYGLLTSSTPIRVTVTDANNSLVYNTLVHPDRFGAFSGSFTPGTNAPLGQDTLMAQVGSDSFTMTFQIAQYRKPDYTVAAAPSHADANYTSGTPVRVDVAARYLFGAPLDRARVHWSVVANDLYFSAPAYPDYTFQDYPFIPFLPFAPNVATRLPGYPAPAGGPSYAFGPGAVGDCLGPCGGGGQNNVVAQGDTRTDADGNLSLAIPADLRRARLSQQWSVEATVSDVNNESISGRTVVSVHKGLFYIGLRGPSSLVVAGQPARLDLLTLGQDGTTLVPRVPLTVRLYRRTYHTVTAPSSFGLIPQWLPVDTLLGAYAAATGATARGTVSVRIPSDGEFRLVATAVDARGNGVRSALSLYASSPDQSASPWAAPPQDRIRVVPDRPLYRVGDVARVLVAAPRPGMTALVTVERGRVYSHQVLRLGGASPILRIPILPGYLPNVFVSVVVVSGTGPRAPAPLWKMGVAELPVDVRARQVHLTIASSATRARPVGRVTLHLHAADAQGRPVQGEFSLAVVDAGVLSLAAEQAAPILDAFYAERGLGVQTAYTQNVAAFQAAAGATVAEREKHTAVYAASAPTRQGGGGGGGAGGGPAARLRAHFPDTAYWNPSVLTDAAGNATLTVPLPDSLTTWRVTARGLTADTLVGQATLDVVSTLDLLLRPVIPRFFTLNDSAQVGAVVNNTTGRPLLARVSLSASGLGTPVVAPATAVTIPAGGEQLVTWPLRPRSLGVARLVLSVSASGVAGDSVVASAPIQPNSTPEVVATSGEVETSRLEQVTVPAAAQPGEGDVTLTLQPSLAAGLRSSVDYLQHFPYESNEDVAARLMGEVALARLPASVTGLSAATLAAYRRDIAGSIGLLLAAQRGDGGWGWWIGDPYSSPAITAFCLDALTVARRAGYTVLGGGLRAARGYITYAVQSATSSPLAAAGGITGVTPDLRAYMAYLLDANGAADAGTALFPARDTLPLWARGYLLRALYLENGNQLGPRGHTVLAELEAGAHLDAAGAHWEDAGSYATMDDPVHATAVVLDALVETDPASPLIAPATRWLMAARRGEVWETTVDNAVALRTLSDGLRGSGELGGHYSYTASLGPAAWGSGTVSPATLAQPRVLSAPLGSPPAPAPGATVPVRLARSNRSGRLYYTLRLTYYPRVDRVAPLARGLTITRTYLYHGQPVTEAPAGAVLQVRLTLRSAQDLYYLRVEDPLPAGAEAVDPTLLTTSQLQQGGYTLPAHVSDLAWYVSHAELRDDRAALFAGYVPAGTYQYQYTVQLTTRGVFHALPAHASETYFPEVFGHGAGGFFTVR